MVTSNLDSSEIPLLAISNEPEYESEPPTPAMIRVHDLPNQTSIETTTYNVSAAIRRRLFISHFLSTWNSRVFEFGAVLYLASIFPKTLLPMSVYAITRGGAAIVFSPAIGRYIDTSNRLQVVRFSISKSNNALAPRCWLGSPSHPTYSVSASCSRSVLHCVLASS